MVTIYKYNNRKLYVPKDQGVSSGYITHNDLADIIRQGKEVQVINKTRDKIGTPTDLHDRDITLEVLKQVMLTLDVQSSVIVDLIKRHRGVQNG